MLKDVHCNDACKLALFVVFLFKLSLKGSISICGDIYYSFYSYLTI